MGFLRRRESAWAGIGAGLIGGLAGTIAIGQFLQLWCKATGTNRVMREGRESTVKAASAVAENVLGQKLGRDQKPAAASLVHFGFGSSMGALYGMARALAPRTPTGCGTLFGAGLYLGAHVGAVPALGLGRPVLQKPLVDEAGELLGHVVYGLVTELTRRGVLAAAR
jgi:putative membrane protein